jgi:hypothetical protein
MTARNLIGNLESRAIGHHFLPARALISFINCKK